MKNRNTLIMSGLLALTLGLGVSGTAFAYQGDYTKKGPNYSQEFETEMTKVMNNNDYDGWKKLVQNKTGRVDEVITKDNFAKFAEAWRLAKEGKIKEANTLRKELGLRTSDGLRSNAGQGNGNGRGRGNGMGMRMHNTNR